jgi:hypothetical protein
MFWDADAIQGQAALKAHDHVITEKLQAVIKAAPPEHTIIGGLGKVGREGGRERSADDTFEHVAQMPTIAVCVGQPTAAAWWCLEYHPVINRGTLEARCCHLSLVTIITGT